MTTIADKLKSIRQCKTNLSTIISKSVITCEKDIVYAIQDQLWDGKDSTGKDLLPSYLDDPFFKTRKAAEAYALWKSKITPNSNRNYYTPNLYINGYFWSSMKIDPATLRMDSAVAFGKPIIPKYGENAFKLGKQHGEVIEKLREQLISNARKELSL